MSKESEAGMKQGSAEWRFARAGSLGAASIHGALAKLKKGGWSATRAKVMERIITERLTGVPANGFQTPAMQWGIEQEPKARAVYSSLSGKEVKEVGLFRHSTIAWAHASPDGAVDDLGLIEIKCPTTPIHFDILTTEVVPPEYVTQMQWQMACTGFGWCDFVSYDPRVAPVMQLFTKLVLRDDACIAELEAGAREFLAEVDARIEVLRQRYGDLTPPPPPTMEELGYEPIEV